MMPTSLWCRKGYHELNSGTLQMLMRPAAASGVLFDYACIPDIGTLVSIKRCIKTIDPRTDRLLCSTICNPFIGAQH